MQSQHIHPKIIAQGSAWAKVKEYDQFAIPSDDAQKHYEELSLALKELGIFIVSVGEIENFCPYIGNHGPKFVTELLQKKSLADPDLKNLRDFVECIHK